MAEVAPMIDSQGAVQVLFSILMYVVLLVFTMFLIIPFWVQNLSIYIGLYICCSVATLPSLHKTGCSLFDCTSQR